MVPLLLTSSPPFLFSSLSLSSRIEPSENISDRRRVGVTLIRRVWPVLPILPSGGCGRKSRKLLEEKEKKDLERRGEEQENHSGVSNLNPSVRYSGQFLLSRGKSSPFSPVLPPFPLCYFSFFLSFNFFLPPCSVLRLEIENRTTGKEKERGVSRSLGELRVL